MPERMIDIPNFLLDALMIAHFSGQHHRVTMRMFMLMYPDGSRGKDLRRRPATVTAAEVVRGTGLSSRDALRVLDSLLRRGVVFDAVAENGETLYGFELDVRKWRGVYDDGER